VRAVIDEELERLRAEFGDEVYGKSRADDAREIFERVALGDEFVEFLTLPAYEHIERSGNEQ
jgi:malate synthase